MGKAFGIDHHLHPRMISLNLKQVGNLGSIPQPLTFAVFEQQRSGEQSLGLLFRCGEHLVIHRRLKGTSSQRDLLGLKRPQGGEYLERILGGQQLPPLSAGVAMTYPCCTLRAASRGG